MEHKKRTISNDFGTGDLDVKPWLLNRGKGMVELRTCLITVKQLCRTIEWRTREHMEGWLTKPSFLLGKVEVQLRKDSFGWYLILTGNIDPIIIQQTPCNYGGYREWLECPECKKRRGLLYRDNGKFKCRKCLELVYYTQKINYRGLEPVIRNMKKLDDLEDTPESRIRFYKNNLTKRTERYKKLSYKVGLETKTFLSKLK